MSAWRISEKTLSYLTSYLQHKLRDSNYFKDKAEKLGMTDSESIFNTMQELNNLALRERYQDADKFFELNNIYTYRPNGIPSLYQVLKSFECFLYQCAEGKAYENDEYLFFKEVKNSLMSDIVSDIPEYNNAKWD